MRKLQVTQSNITRLQHQVNKMKLEVDKAYKTSRETNKKYKKLVDKILVAKRKAVCKETRDVLDKILEDAKTSLT